MKDMDVKQKKKYAGGRVKERFVSIKHTLLEVLHG